MLKDLTECAIIVAVLMALILVPIVPIAILLEANQAAFVIVCWIVTVLCLYSLFLMKFAPQAHSKAWAPNPDRPTGLAIGVTFALWLLFVILALVHFASDSPAHRPKRRAKPARVASHLSPFKELAVKNAVTVRPTFGGRPLDLLPAFKSEPLEILRPQSPLLAPTSNALFACRTQDDLFRDLPGCIERVRKAWQEDQDFFHQVVACNVELRNVSNSEIHLDRLPTRFLAEVTPPQFPIRSLAEIATKADEQIHGDLCAALNHMMAEVIAKEGEALRILAEKEVIGRAHWLDKTVARFHFFRWIVEDRAGDVRSYANHTERDVKRSLRQQIHVHEVRKAQRHHYNAAITVPAPVKTLLQKTPTHLRPHVQIITGDEIFRAVFEREIHSETRTEIEAKPVYQYDPVVVLGDYVLTGW